MFVPVKSKSGNQKLMPTHPNKAGILIKKGLATPYWSNGIFCIRLNYDTQAHRQEICVGVDPGSKKEGFTVKSGSHTYLNVQADAHEKVGKKVEKRRQLRRGRRSRKCPKKLAETFDAHCVDSWCLAYHTIGGSEDTPDNTAIFCIAPIPIRRRELHRQNPQKGGRRPRYGGTVLGNGIAKNTLVKHIKYGLTRLSGINAKGLFSLYDLHGNRLATGAKRTDFQVLTRLNFNYKPGV